VRLRGRGWGGAAWSGENCDIDIAGVGALFSSLAASLRALAMGIEHLYDSGLDYGIFRQTARRT